jgi:hypothetical protein
VTSSTGVSVCANADTLALTNTNESTESFRSTDERKNKHMAIEIKATVKYLLDTKQITEKFSKRSVVVEVPDGKYPQTLELEATGDRIAQLDVLSPGDVVTFHVNLRGREKKNQDGAFNSLDIWKLTVDAKAAKPNSPAFGDQNSIPF